MGPVKSVYPCMHGQHLLFGTRERDTSQNETLLNLYHCNGKFGEGVKFPIGLGPLRGPWNLGVVTGIVPRGLLAKRGILHYCLRAQHIEW